MEHGSKAQYQLRARRCGSSDAELSVWQIPCAATPYMHRPLRIAGLRSRNLALVEHLVLRRLALAGISLAKRGENAVQRFDMDEETAIWLGLLCRVLAPMRSAERMRRAVQNMDDMNPTEAAYWMGMALHRGRATRVMSALRILLT